MESTTHTFVRGLHKNGQSARLEVSLSIEPGITQVAGMIISKHGSGRLASDLFVIRKQPPIAHKM